MNAPYVQNPQPPTTNRPKRFGFVVLAAAIALSFVLGFAAGSSGSSTTVAPSTPAAAALEGGEIGVPPGEPIGEMIPEPVDLGVAAFGQRVEFANGVAVTVSVPEGYDPSKYARVVGRPVKVTITVENNSADVVEPSMIYVAATHGGLEAERVFDSANDIGSAPSNTLRPGKAVSWPAVFALGAEPAELQVDVNPLFSFAEPAVFVGTV